MVARQTGRSRFFSAAAGVILGIHGSRPEAATWIAGRFDLLATLFVLATLSLFMRGKYVAALMTILSVLKKGAACLGSGTGFYPTPVPNNTSSPSLPGVFESGTFKIGRAH